MSQQPEPEGHGLLRSIAQGRHPATAIRRLKDLRQAARFGTIGVLNTGLDLGLFLLLTRGAYLQPVIASTFSYGAGMACSFCLNRTWTFRGSAAGPSGQFARFVALNFTLLTIGNAALALLLMIMPALPAKLVVVMASFPVSFLLSKNLVFVFRHA